MVLGVTFFFTYVERERKKNIDLFSHSFMHSLVDSCYVPRLGVKPEILA